MTNLTDRAEQIRARQSEAVSVLDELLSFPLPGIEWNISTIYAGKLEGQIVGYMRPDEDVRADLQKWAEFLGVEITERKISAPPAYLHIAVQTKRDNVLVDIWAHIEREK